MSDTGRDPYQVLGIGPDATGADVTRAWRQRVRAVHPDSRPGDPAAAGQFRALSEAYSLLSDPARRAAWDHQHPPRPAPPDAPPPAAARPALWPVPPAAPPWLPGGASPVRGATLRVGPVHIQPPAPDRTGQHARAAADPSLGALLAWLLGPGPEWPW